MTPSVSVDWMRLPKELRSLPNWCVAGPDKAPYMAGNNGLYHASPTKGPWHTFEQACNIAYQHQTHIGYVLTKEDPFTCIDLDVKDKLSKDANGNFFKPELWTSQKELDIYCKIVSAFDSYSELSSGGKGNHIIVRGAIGEGVRRDGVEVYSQERFIICTGNEVNAIHYQIINDVVNVQYQNDRRFIPLERQELLNSIVTEINCKRAPQIELKEVDEDLTDREIIDRAINASNANKFNELCKGDWQAMRYKSQSEADLSLMSMFTFYSKSNDQCKRLFRLTGLGVREKAVKNDVYLNRTLKIIRSRQEDEELVETDLIRQAADLVKNLQSKREKELVAQVKEVSETPLPKVDGIPWPPGMVGALAAFIYNSAPRPVKEVAIVAALGLMAGIAGKSFVFSQSGLNLYIILIARSAIGKEAMHSGVSLILDKIRQSVPAIENFVDFSDFASGPALTKACAANQSFVNIAGEWGRKLKRLALEDGRDGPMQQLRTVMTNLYQKSGPASVVGGLSYSDRDRNIASVSGVAYSMIGETTPGTFFDSLSDSMMEDGFLSRFSIIEYVGERPPANPNPATEPDSRLTEALCGLVTQSLTMLSRYQTLSVQFDPIAKKILEAFDKECDKEINSTQDEAWRQMWNRAHLKTIRIACLLAVGDNYINPVVYENHVKWALDLIRSDIKLMQRRIKNGDVGQGDPVREKKLISVINSYLENPLKKSYNISEKLRDAGIIPRSFLQIRTSRVTAFTNHRLGSTMALDSALRSLCDSGYIMECNKDKVIKEYGAHGRCFRILNLPNFKD